jgi:hypothetical protein
LGAIESRIEEHLFFSSLSRGKGLDEKTEIDRIK